MTHPISVRLSDDKWRVYSEQAQTEGVGLSTYLKHRLERDDQVLEELVALRREIETFSLIQPKPSSEAKQSVKNGFDPQLQAILFEMLLLMRSAVGEAKISIVHGELRRQNLPIWRGEK